MNDESKPRYFPSEERAIAEGRCPNCYDPLPKSPSMTRTGEIVCDPLCAKGWNSGISMRIVLDRIAALLAP